jgi:hypothetical protein
VTSEWGHHLYAGQAWSNPFDALSLAKQLGDTAPQIEFVMPAANRIDWSVEPEGSLADLYARRAGVLRDRFDYLILLYSGGSDSHQMLMAFLNARIHLDEVCTICPMKWAEGIDLSGRPDDPLGLLQEHHLAAVPGLRTLSLRSPKTKITILDTTDAYSGDMEWPDGLFGARMSGGLHGLYQAVRRVRVARDLQRRAERLGGRVGVLIGAEKPYLRLRGGELTVHFDDCGRVGIEHFWQHGSDLLYEPVMFYWGDPTITCKQAHVVKKALGADPGLISNTEAHKRLIYPDWRGSYQRRQPLCGDVLMACVGERAAVIAADRTRFYAQMFKGLSGIGRITNEEPKIGIGTRVVLLARKTKSYRIGSLSCASLLDGS